MNTNDPIRDRIEAAERMLHQAKQEHNRGSEDVAEFLAAAQRRIGSAIEGIKKTSHVTELPRVKEASHAR